MKKQKLAVMAAALALCLFWPFSNLGASVASGENTGSSGEETSVGGSVTVTPEGEEGTSHSSAEYGKTQEGKGKTEFTGYIEPSIINVALPTDVKFAVDTGRELTKEYGFSQAINPPDDLLTIENMGVDLRLTAEGISGVTSQIKNKAGEFEKFQLVSSVSNMPVPSALFSLRLTSDKPQSIEDLESRAITEANTADNKSILIGDIPGGGSAVINAYCVVAGNYKTGAYSFYVTPTIKAEYRKK